VIRYKVTETGQISKTDCQFREGRRSYQKAWRVRARHTQKCGEDMNLHRSLQFELSF
jgi:hypothetical protein